MNKLYNKSELWFSIIFIVIYIVGASLCDLFSDMINISKIFTFCFLFVLSLFLFVWIKKNNLSEKYGLCLPKYKAKSFLFYIPLLILVTTNFWFGIKLNYNLIECLFNVLTMLCVGFVEEIVFRGFLFKSLEKDNVKMAIIISSVTFGVGHLVNMLSNGFNNLLPNICQVFYAMAVGFLFVVIFYRGGSLIPCILTHSLVNAFSIFQNTQAISPLIDVLISIAIIVVSIIYSLILLKTLKTNEKIKIIYRNFENFDVIKIDNSNIEEVFELCKHNKKYYEYLQEQLTIDWVKKITKELPPKANSKDKYFVGIYQEEKLIAVLDLIVNYPLKGKAFIGFFMMDKISQGKGIGKKLIINLLNFLKSNKYDSCELGVVENNVEAISFWTKLGFEKTGEIYNHENYNVIMMSHKL